MMHRRTLLQMLGIGAVASAIPMFPASAITKSAPTLNIVAYTRGPKSERYHHHMPARAYYAPGDKPYRENLVIDCESNFTGTVVTLDVRHGENVLLTMKGSELNTPHIVRGSNIRLTLTGS